MRHQGVFGIEWDKCDRCGFEYPINMLTMQLGQKLCPKDVDDLSNYYRPKVIAEVMRGPEGQSDKPEVFRNPQELEF